VAANVIVAVFDEAGSNVAPRDATRVVNVLPSVPSSDSVCVRAPQIGSGFSFTTTLVMLWFAPRATVSVFG